MLTRSPPRFAVPSIATLLLGFVAGGCGSSDANPGTPDPVGSPDAGPEASKPDAAPPDAAADGDDSDADGAAPDGSTVTRVTILHTGEERGRVLPQPSGDKVIGGAANIAAWWKQKESYTPDSHLVLSSGDSWTGPATSTWLKGENVVEVMGLMGYRAATIGPRDHDFGRDVLLQRIAEATHDTVSANTLQADTGSLVDFAEPYVIVPVNGVQVGVIGLMDVNHDVNPAEVSDLTFGGYASTVEKYALEARGQGAQVLVVLASATLQDMLALAGSLVIPVDAVLAGRYISIAQSSVIGGTVVAHSAGHWIGYHRIEIDFDLAAGEVLGRTVQWVPVEYAAADGNPVVPDPAVEAAVEKWEQAAAGDLEREIGYTESGIPQRSWPQANWVTDSWLAAFPEADLAIQNSGGLQADIAPGPITVGDIVALAPYENYIYSVEMKGAGVQASLQAMVDYCGTQCFPAVAGMRYDNSASELAVTLSDGTPIDAAATYTVLVNSYIYHGGAGFPYDPALTPVATGVHMRDPVIDWTEQLGSTALDPLEAHIDLAPRNQ